MRKQKNIHYLYKTTCLVTDRYYIGMHSTNNLDDGYTGSGRRLRRSIRKHGEENHKVEILEFYNTRELLIEAEIEAITPEMITDKDCMNLMGGGTGGFISDEHQKKRAIAGNKALNEKLTNKEFRDEFSKKVSEGLKKSYENGREGKNYFSWKGKTRSEEVKIKMSESSKGQGKGLDNSQFGTCWITNGNDNKKIKKEDLDMYTIEGWDRGKTTIDKKLLLEMKTFYDKGNSYQKTSDKFNIPKSTIIDNFKKKYYE
jgi:hypothetical protein